MIRARWMGLVVATVVAVSASQPASAATPSGKRVARVVHALKDRYPLRSTIFGVWIKRRPLVTEALGQARPGVPATTRDHFRIGNITESMTVTMLLQLVDEGRVRLNDPLSTWFPHLRKAKKVSVGMLARSTSGYAHYAANRRFVRAFHKHPHRHWKLADVLDFAFRLPQVFDPGASWGFSDTNFLLLGKVLRRVGGKSVSKMLHERILSKLGMDETAMRTTAFIRSPVLHGYTSERGHYEDSTSWSPSILKGAANATSTLGDLGKWASALGTGSLVSRRSHRLQTGSENVGLDGQTEKFHYAMGSGVSNGWIYNNPSLFGYQGVLAYLPSKQVALVVLTTDGPRGKLGARYDEAIANRIGRLIVPKQGPDLPFCLSPPCR
jgi:D-alanyl-D-alanine carboxypeptidase